MGTRFRNFDRTPSQLHAGELACIGGRWREVVSVQSPFLGYQQVGVRGGEVDSEHVAHVAVRADTRVKVVKVVR